MLERYTTERLAPAQKIRRWCDFGSSTLSRIVVQPYEPGLFRAQLVRAMLGDIGVTHLTSSAAIAESPSGSVGAWAGSREGALAITYYKAGHPRLSQEGRTLQCAPGDIVIRDLRKSWHHDSVEAFSLMTVKVPLRCLAGAAADLDSCIMQPLRSGDPRASLLSSMIDNLGRMAFEAPHTPHPDAVERLLRASIELSFGQKPASPANARRGLPPEIVRYLVAHLQDPDLSVAGMARDCGMNIRSLQRLFHQAGTTPKAYIQARRLEFAAEQLRGPASAGRNTITNLALSLGFNDSGYFSRVFHEHHGMTPTEYLRRHSYPI